MAMKSLHMNSDEIMDESLQCFVKEVREKGIEFIEDPDDGQEYINADHVFALCNIIIRTTAISVLKQITGKAPESMETFDKQEFAKALEENKEALQDAILDSMCSEETKH